MEDWLDRGFTKRCDAAASEGNPTRTGQLDLLLCVLEDEYQVGQTILDVGSGSGIVEGMIFERLPRARVVGIDCSRAMIELAHERLRSYEGRYRVVKHDLTDLTALKLPDETYSVAISVQTLHNLSDIDQKRTVRFVYDTLVDGGLFLDLDRIRVSGPGLYSCYRSAWRRLERVHGNRISAAPTYGDYLRDWAARDEHPVELEENVARLREAGFEAACLHTHGDRALFAARKKV